VASSQYEDSKEEVVQDCTSDSAPKDGLGGSAESPSDDRDFPLDQEATDQDECGGKTLPPVPVDVFRMFGTPSVTDTPNTMRLGLQRFIHNTDQAGQEYMMPPAPSRFEERGAWDPQAFQLMLPSTEELAKLYSQFQYDSSVQVSRPPPALQQYGGSMDGRSQVSRRPTGLQQTGGNQ
jgi:hypothetical protein